MRKHWIKTWAPGDQSVASDELRAVREINAHLPFAEPIQCRGNEAVGWPSSAEIGAFGPFGYVEEGK